MNTYEQLKLELLLVSRAYYRGIPFNSIDMFICCNEYHSLNFFMQNIYGVMYNIISPATDRMLDEIKKELENRV